MLVKNPDGSPAAGESISVTVSGGYRSGFRMTNNFTSDSNGIVPFAIVDLEDITGSVSIRVSAYVVLSNFFYLSTEDVYMSNSHL